MRGRASTGGITRVRNSATRRLAARLKTTCKGECVMPVR
jgi:hypothetical protein